MRRKEYMHRQPDDSPGQDGGLFRDKEGGLLQKKEVYFNSIGYKLKHSEDTIKKTK
ncbi:MAG TPA: hypothetical protein VNR87_01025 [Flavisolibacter sp.]|nr:hypothetical protein [Flavisolibacter sp.]